MGREGTNSTSLVRGTGSGVGAGGGVTSAWANEDATEGARPLPLASSARATRAKRVDSVAVSDEVDVVGDKGENEEDGAASVVSPAPRGRRTNNGNVHACGCGAIKKNHYKPAFVGTEGERTLKYPGPGGFVFAFALLVRSDDVCVGRR